MPGPHIFCPPLSLTARLGYFASTIFRARSTMGAGAA